MNSNGKNLLHNFKETLCLISNFWKKSLRLFTMIAMFLLNFVYFRENCMTKSLRTFSSFMTVCPYVHVWLVGWLVLFIVPSTARSFRDGTPIYRPLRRTWSSINTPFRSGIEPRAVAWQSITLPLRYASSTHVQVWCHKILII